MLLPDPLDPSVWIVGDATDAVVGAHHGATVIRNVHSASACAGRHCVIHNPSDHALRGWPLVWRDDKGVFERQCPHGQGHIDPDSAEYLRLVGAEHLGLHACDGCCHDGFEPRSADIKGA